MQIAVLVYPQMTALDAVGPYEVLSRLPGATVSWVAATQESIVADAGLTLVPTATFAAQPRPSVIIVPGGRESFAIQDPAALAWLRAAHPHTRFTASVCTGALVLGAAGLLRGVRATTHWYKLGELRDYGARPSRRASRRASIWASSSPSSWPAAWWPRSSSSPSSTTRSRPSVAAHFAAPDGSPG